ncbi:MAG: vWA domain-containing protein [Pseudomonadota bacterium]
MIRARVAVGIASLLCAVGSTPACSSNSKDGSHASANDPNAGAGTGAGAGANTPGAGIAGGLNILGPETGGGDGNSPGNDPLGDTCKAHVSSAEPIPLDMYIMLDTSGSMKDQTSARTSKWAAVKAALKSFLEDQSSAGLGVGLQFFPLDEPKLPASCASNADCGANGPCWLKTCSNDRSFYPCDQDSDCQSLRSSGTCVPLGTCSGDPTRPCSNVGQSCGRATLGQCVAVTTSTCTNPESCDPAVYAKPASEIATLPAAAPGLLASIDAKMPVGGTPTAPALSGALQQASAWAKAHPDHRVVAVLATDGLPTSCTPTDIDGVAALAKAGVQASPSINTFVIGVFGRDDVQAGASDNLNKIAVQGGTKAAFIVDTQNDVTAQFVSALNTIRGSHVACEFQVPAAGAGQTVDYGQVNVKFTSAGKSSYIYYVEGQSACDATTGGWYYDVLPKKGTPTKIIACPATCTTIQSAKDESSVDIALGCGTIVK